jgi:hypothetical protein
VPVLFVLIRTMKRFLFGRCYPRVIPDGYAAVKEALAENQGSPFMVRIIADSYLKKGMGIEKSKDVFVVDPEVYDRIMAEVKKAKEAT